MDSNSPLAILTRSFPLWQQLSPEEQAEILKASSLLNLQKGEELAQDESPCAGLLIINKGMLRFYTLSEDGKEITLQRLHGGDISILSASCVLPPIDFNIWCQAWENCSILQIKPCVLAKLMQKNIYLTAEIYALATRTLANITTAMQRMLFASFDKRLAHFLLEEAKEQDSLKLKITHEQIAKFIGTAREVVTRMLNQFADNNYVELTRGKVEILAVDKLKAILQAPGK